MAASADLIDARFWNGVARKYARDPIADPEGYERTLSRIFELAGPTDRVLEIGCGTGTTALRLAPKVAHLAATDVSREMIAIANEKQAAAGVANVAFTVASATVPASQPGSFDAVLALNVLHLLADRAAVYGAIRLALRPGGLFMSKTPCIREMNPLIRLGIPVARAIGKAPWVDVFAAPALEAEITAAGFTILERARHGSGGKDPRIVLVARAP